MSRRLSAKGVAAAAEIVGCDEAAIRAVIDTESNGRGFDGDLVVIRWERHIAVRLAPDADTRAMFKRLPKANPADQAGRHALLDEACLIHKETALKACSWGLMQVMGFNHAACGFATVGDFVDAMGRGEDAQVAAAARFIVTKGLDDEICRHDWRGFARGYNGKDYKANRYDEKLARNWARHGGGDHGGTAGLGLGAEGHEVEALQRRLTALGFAVRVDGDFGAETRAQLRAFQLEHGLATSGRLDAATMRALEDAPPLVDEERGLAGTTAASGVGKGALGTAAGGVAATVKGVADAVTGDDAGGIVDTVAEAGDRARQVTDAVDGLDTLGRFVWANLPLAIGIVLAVLGVWLFWRNHRDIVTGKKKS